MEKKYLLLVTNDELHKEKYPHVDIYPIYKKVGRFIRIIRYFHLKSNILNFVKPFWFDIWHKHLTKYEKIVFYDSLIDNTIFSYLQKNAPSAQKAICYRNRVNETVFHGMKERNPIKLKEKYGCEMWSYNIEDCRDYNMNYYDQFVLLENTISQQKIKNDVFFIGKDKGRSKIIKDIVKKFDELGVSYKICIVPDKKTNLNEIDPQWICNPMSYDDVIYHIGESKCILDIVGDTNKGVTYRPLEALVLKKKLITNLTDICKENFYNPQNVFIWNKDNTCDLLDFINTDFVVVDDSIIDKHTFRYFLNKVFGLI